MFLPAPGLVEGPERDVPVTAGGSPWSLRLFTPIAVPSSARLVTDTHKFFLFPGIETSARGISKVCGVPLTGSAVPLAATAAMGFQFQQRRIVT